MKHYIGRLYSVSLGKAEWSNGGLAGLVANIAGRRALEIPHASLWTAGHEELVRLGDALVRPMIEWLVGRSDGAGREDVLAPH